MSGGMNSHLPVPASVKAARDKSKLYASHDGVKKHILTHKRCLWFAAAVAYSFNCLPTRPSNKSVRCDSNIGKLSDSMIFGVTSPSRMQLSHNPGVAKKSNDMCTGSS